MKRMNIVVINGEEKELSSLSLDVQEKLAAEWNRRALAAIGYEPVQAVKKITFEDVKLTIGMAVIVYGIIGLMFLDFFSKSGY